MGTVRAGAVSKLMEVRNVLNSPGPALRLPPAAENPGFSILVIAVLALGIGATSAVFSVVNAVLLRPAPFRD